MAPLDRCLASMARPTLTQPLRPTASSIPKYLAPALVQTRNASVVRIKGKTKQKSTIPKDFRRHKLDKRGFPQYSLCEAMHILRSYEVGQPSASVKYDVAINLKSTRSGPVVRSSVRLPYPVQSDFKIAVICPEGSDIANEAIGAGAVAVGEKAIFDAIREEKITFDRLLCHEESEKALNQANLGRILGPKGLMPSQKTKTIVSNVASAIRDSAGAAEYREREGVIRLAVGRLGNTPVELKSNIQALITKVKKEVAALSVSVPKDVHEIILSTTNGPGISLNGKLRDLEDKVTEADVSGIM